MAKGKKKKERNMRRKKRNDDNKKKWLDIFFSLIFIYFSDT